MTTKTDYYDEEVDDRGANHARNLVTYISVGLSGAGALFVLFALLVLKH